jgi:hypothetical protein
MTYMVFAIQGSSLLVTDSYISLQAFDKLTTDYWTKKRLQLFIDSKYIIHDAMFIL